MELNADIVVMLHPDYQYTPKLIPQPLLPYSQRPLSGCFWLSYSCKGALKGGMPMYKYIFNRMLTFSQNLLINQNFPNTTGYRAFSKEVINGINYHANSDDFVFDNQMISQIFMQVSKLPK